MKYNILLTGLAGLLIGAAVPYVTIPRLDFSQIKEMQRSTERRIDKWELPKEFKSFGELVDYGEHDLGKVTNIHTADLDGDGDLDVIVSTDSHVFAIENKMYLRAPKE